MRNSGAYSAALLVLTALILGAWFLWLAPMGCAQRAGAMHVNYYYHPVDGCFIQQPNGSWMPIDNNRTYYQP